MRTFTKTFLGVKDGEIYPTTFAKGDECPTELEEAASSVGALEMPEPDEKPGSDKGGADKAKNK